MVERAVRVRAHGRLHLGFLDLNGGLGREFGSLGLAIDGLGTDVEVSLAATDRVDASGPDAERAARFAGELLRHAGIEPGHAVTVHAAVPPHAGLGSGTQLALAVGAALVRLHGLDLPLERVATVLGRGRRSSIGIGTFREGGFVLDGGRRVGAGDHDGPPPLLLRAAFPGDWRLVLVFDHAARGLSGMSETRAFETLPEFPGPEAATLCRIALMQLLPALQERDIVGFGAAVTRIQEVVGDHFAPAQGGRFASPRVAAVLAAFASLGAAGVGQSSWGPTGFALVASEAEACRLCAEVEARHPDHGCELRIHRALNAPARVDVSA